MASLPKIPFTNIDDARVAVDAPLSTDLMTDIVVNENYLKAVLTDGALAPQTISANAVTVNGVFTANSTSHFVGDAQFDANVNISGTLTTGAFFSSNQLLFFP